MKIFMVIYQAVERRGRQSSRIVKKEQKIKFSLRNKFLRPQKLNFRVKMTNSPPKIVQIIVKNSISLPQNINFQVKMTFLTKFVKNWVHSWLFLAWKSTKNELFHRNICQIMAVCWIFVFHDFISGFFFVIFDQKWSVESYLTEKVEMTSWWRHKTWLILTK